jgi:putative membrane protein
MLAKVVAGSAHPVCPLVVTGPIRIGYPAVLTGTGVPRHSAFATHDPEAASMDDRDPSHGAGADSGGAAPVLTSPHSAASAPHGSGDREGPGAMLLHALQGLLMGTADVIPGVSGGTVALILGIFERLVDSIRHIAAGGVALVKGDRAQAAAHWRETEFRLVVPLVAGIVLALGIGSLTLPHLIETYPVITSALFFGLIAGALPIPWRRMSARAGVHYALAALGAVAAFVLAGFAPHDIAEPALPLVFGAAAIAICAMILPGVSGAYLLLVMGMYEVTLEALSSLDLVYIGVFTAGIITGLGAFSQLLSWLLEHRHDATMAVLVGLMAGSLRRLWPWHTESGTLLAAPDGGALLLAAGCAVTGIVLVVGLTAIGERAAIHGRDGV